MMDGRKAIVMVTAVVLAAAGALAEGVSLSASGPAGEVLKKVADLAGVHLVLTGDLDRQVKVDFKDIPWETAVREIARRGGYSVWIEGKYVVVSEEKLGLHLPLAMIPEVSPKKPVTLEYDDAPLARIVDDIASQVGVNIVVMGGKAADLLSRKFPGRARVSVSLRDVHWRKALELVARAAGYSVEMVSGNLYVVKPVEVVLKAVDRPIREVLKDIADQSGINVVVSPTVKGNVTVSLEGVSWIEALDAIVTALGLSWTRYGENTVLVTGQARKLEKEVAFFDVHYLDGSRVYEALKVIEGKEGGKEAEDLKGKKPPWVLVLNAEPHVIRKVREFLDKYDRPSLASSPLEYDLARREIFVEGPQGRIAYANSLPLKVKKMFVRRFKEVVSVALSERARVEFLPLLDKVRVYDTPQNLSYVRLVVEKNFPLRKKPEPPRKMEEKDYPLSVASAEKMARLILSRFQKDVKAHAEDNVVVVEAPLQLHPKIRRLVKEYDVEPLSRSYAVIYKDVKDLASSLKPMLSPLAEVSVDALTRTITVRAPLPDLDYVERFLRVQDVPPADAVTVKVFPIKFVKAEELAKTLQDFLASMSTIFKEESSASSQPQSSGNVPPQAEGKESKAPPAGKKKVAPPAMEKPSLVTGRIEAVVLADKTSNSIIVTAKGSDMPKIAALIEKLDREPQQVLILGRIVETTATNLSDIGLYPKIAGSIYGASVPTTFPFPKKQKEVYDQLIPDKNPTEVGTSADSAYPPGRLFAYASADQFRNFGMLSFAQLSVTLSLLEQRGDTKLISRPRIVVLNNATAKFLVTETREYRKRGSVTIGQGGQVAFQYEYGTAEDKISVEVSPQITPNGKILLTLRPEVTSFIQFDEIENPDGTKDKLPVQVTRMAETKVLVDDGMTVVLAGLVRNWGRNAKNQVPMLGRIPLLGKLFSREVKEQRDRNLLFFFTPIIMKEGESMEAQLKRVEEAYAALDRRAKEAAAGGGKIGEEVVGWKKVGKLPVRKPALIDGRPVEKK